MLSLFLIALLAILAAFAIYKIRFSSWFENDLSKKERQDLGKGRRLAITVILIAVAAFKLFDPALGNIAAYSNKRVLLGLLAGILLLVLIENIIRFRKK
ncbi:MAG: hypothetical protein JWN50_722 [Parcubacteria group bacterium]|nr:hypothetical protein [Parcubacteria group bacterium]